MSVPICINCQFYTLPEHKSMEVAKYSRCSAGPETDLVTGAVQLVFCDLSRANLSRCGPEGKLFVAKEESQS
jgi:hypothetical protein